MFIKQSDRSYLQLICLNFFNQFFRCCRSIFCCLLFCCLKVNPIALRKAKIAYNFGLSECNWVNQGYKILPIDFCYFLFMVVYHSLQLIRLSIILLLYGLLVPLLHIHFLSQILHGNEVNLMATVGLTTSLSLILQLTLKLL